MHLRCVTTLTSCRVPTGAAEQSPRRPLRVRYADVDAVMASAAAGTGVGSTGSSVGSSSDGLVAQIDFTKVSKLSKFFKADLSAPKRLKALAVYGGTFQSSVCPPCFWCIVRPVVVLSCDYR